jgi:hypothetical protein
MTYLKNYYERMDAEQNIALKNVDNIIRDMDGYSSFDNEDIYFDDDLSGI